MPIADSSTTATRLNPVTIVISLLTGYLAYISPGFAFCLLLIIALFYITINHTDDKDRRFVLCAMCSAMVLRSLAIILVQYCCFRKGVLDIFGDAANNFHLGYGIEDVFKGNYNQLKILEEQTGWYNVHGLTFFNGIFFTLFGKNEIITLKHINGLAMVISGWLIYDLTKEICSSRAGKIALCAVLFWPTLFVWSITGLKESHLIFSLIFMFWCLSNFLKERLLRKRLYLSILIILSGCYAVSLRRPLLILIPFTFVTTFIPLLFSRYKNRTLAEKKTIFFISVISIFCLLNYRTDIFQMLRNSYEKLIAYHRGYLGSGGWNYSLLGGSNNYYSLTFFAKYLTGAWFHFLLEPLPWHIFSLSMLASYPMMIIWYGVVFLSLIGVARVMQDGKTKEIFPFLIFTISYISMIGMSIANIGTVVRFRDTIMPIIAIFASCGLIKSSNPFQGGQRTKT